MECSSSARDTLGELLCEFSRFQGRGHFPWCVTSFPLCISEVFVWGPRINSPWTATKKRTSQCKCCIQMYPVKFHSDDITLQRFIARLWLVFCWLPCYALNQPESLLQRLCLEITDISLVATYKTTFELKKTWKWYFTKIEKQPRDNNKP